MDLLNARARLRVSFAAILIGLLAGCGGGDDGGSAATSSSSNSPSPGSAANAPPAVTGKPGTSVSVGHSYSFQPSATDANGDSLSFTASNVPSWASFSSTNGRLTGKPSAGDVGTYSGITIMVSDGKATTSVGPFTITVAAAGSGAGSATLSWTPPTQNSDGTALTNLAGYKILYGDGADNLDQSIEVENSSVNTYVVENLTAGTWYFAVVAVNTSGLASVPSNVASKTIS